MDNWRKLKGYGFKGFTNASSKQDKGHFNQFQALLTQQKKGGAPIISINEIINTTKASLAAVESLKNNKWIEIE